MICKGNIESGTFRDTSKAITEQAVSYNQSGVLPVHSYGTFNQARFNYSTLCLAGFARVDSEIGKGELASARNAENTVVLAVTVANE
jgi:ABC-type tungstate transport system substrate-binding protein